MISIQPKWCGYIASGLKTIEVRKTRPKIDTPFKCYIYETYDKKYVGVGTYFFDTKVDYKHHCKKVIGEFVCNRIDDYSQWEFDYYSLLRHIELFSKAGYEFLDKYLKGQKKGFGWHISDLVIYDKPKEISEFYSTKCDMPCEHKKRGFNMDFCMAYENGSHFCKELNCDKKRLTRPPQSWCYVEEKENESD